MNFNVIFTKEPNKNEELFLEPGTHSYKFETNIPYECPTSFEHAFGRIQYTVSCTIDIPW